MSILYTISTGDTDSYLLGEKTFHISDPSIKKYCHWQFGENGKPHPAICPTCGRVLRPELWDKDGFQLRKRKCDMGTTYDGGHIVSDRAKGFLTDHLSCALEFTQLPKAKGYHRWDLRNLPSLAVSIDASHIRQGKYCDACGAFAEVLRGLEPGSPPTVLPLVFDDAPARGSLYRTDIAFGSNHAQWFTLVATEGLARKLYDAKLRDVYVVENIICKAGRPPIKKF
ncbi:MAG: hypothetical protein HN341_14585 [Verrucomicrobia bacterium]|jgi:hypothetical protein|nr:hypothetical protein [Verrucomicrobiota bacterium]